MIYDPFDVKIAMDCHGRILTPASYGQDEDGNPVPEWVVTEEINFRGEFRRPEW